MRREGGLQTSKNKKENGPHTGIARVHTPNPRFEVTVSSDSLSPFMSPRGLFSTNQRLSLSPTVYVAPRYFQQNQPFSKHHIALRTSL